MSGHALPYRRCDAAGMFTVTKDENGGADAVIAAANDYLKIFAAPVRNADGKPACFHCGEPMDGLMNALGVGVAVRWGMTHGEGTCSGCGWPYRGMHYIKFPDGSDLASVRNLFLAYHPDEVTSEEKAA